MELNLALDGGDRIWLLDSENIYTYENPEYALHYESQLETRLSSDLKKNQLVNQNLAEKSLGAYGKNLEVKNKTDNERLIRPPKCQGVYCDVVPKMLLNAPDEKDENNNIYVDSESETAHGSRSQRKTSS